jgi:hypothetical protein
VNAESADLCILKRGGLLRGGLLEWIERRPVVFEGERQLMHRELKGQANLAVAMIKNVGNQFDNAEIERFCLFRTYGVMFCQSARPGTGLAGGASAAVQNEDMAARQVHTLKRP